MKTIVNDIANAYLVEQEYIKNNEGTEVSLLDLLRPFGYNTLDEYFGDRFIYLLQQQNLPTEYFTLAEWAGGKVIEKMNECASGVYFPAASGKTCALVGDPAYFNYEVAAELGLTVCNLGYNGGTIITADDDFNMSMILPNSMNLLSKKFMEEFNKFFIKRGYDTYIDGNDILLKDGRKVSGTVFVANEKCGNFSLSVSLHDYTDIINQVCKKKSDKTPGYLSGITKKEIEAEVQSWLQHT